MKKHNRVITILLGVFVVLQLFSSHTAVPQFVEEDDFLNYYSIEPETASLIKTACYDCHSYETSYPWYASVVPVKYWIQSHVKHGREELNFSTWGAYELTTAEQADFIDYIIRLIEKEEMPLQSYTWMHPQAVWSVAQKQQVVESLKTLIQLDTLPDCEWCGAMDAPENLDWQVTIPPKDEVGEPLVVSGTVFQADGKTPAADILLYVYHTNANGIYAKRGDEVGNGQRHGYLRGWMKTNAQGQYKFTTIKPAPYPSGNEAAHIHITLSGAGYAEHWIDNFLFSDDDFISKSEKQRALKKGRFSPILTLQKDENGIWQATRDILLKEKD